jgi:excisionase family DNA binding protein
VSDKAAEIIARLAELEASRAALLAELIALNTTRELDDRLLTVQEAAEILSVTTDWLYRHADEFRFTVRPGPGQLRFSHQGIQEYLKEERA